MPKVLLVANTDWFLYNFRLALARQLRDQGFDVLLVSPPGSFLTNFQEEGFRWISWQIGRKSISPISEIRSLLQLINIYLHEKPDLVHHHTIKPVLYGSLAARISGVSKVVNSITGRGYVFIGKDLKARILKKFVTPFYKIALNAHRNAVIFENQFDREFFVNAGFVAKEHTWLIEGVGVDPDVFQPEPEPEGVPIILMAGRMLWDKGVGVLVEAAQILKSRVEARLVLVGESDPGNPSSIDAETLKKWDQDGIIEWWGWQSDMQSVYRQCHIVTLPTMYGEGVPTSLIEGAACGRPLVATTIPGCLPIVQEGINGLLVAPNDAQALAEALEKLISNRKLRLEMGSKGRELVLERFTHAEVNQITIEVYRRLLASA
jgi:glycosyltransferase involved in cell wall biosynthesis